jgi:hypothetical protein
MEFDSELLKIASSFVCHYLTFEVIKKELPQLESREFQKCPLAFNFWPSDFSPFL